MLIAIEGIDQSGKATQSALLAEWLGGRGRAVHTVSFPDYQTPIGRQIDAFLHGAAGLPPEARHLLFAANRYERRADLAARLAAGETVIADRYSASGIAYGMALGLAREWLANLEARLPCADATVLLDADPAATRARKVGAADAYERDLPLLTGVRAAYRELARAEGWIVVDAQLAVAEVHARIVAALGGG